MAKPRLQHTTVIIHEGGQEAARAFYGGVIGLEEKDPPLSLAHLHVVWFVVGEGDMELHCSPNGPDPQDNEQNHFCLAVDDLAEYRQRLAAAGVAIIEADPIPYRPRFFCHDPFGNMLELTTIEGDYHLAQ
jgi:catechol 2,3-dioxygenase-like lactoylglutathione lyase family enzyme